MHFVSTSFSFYTISTAGKYSNVYVISRLHCGEGGGISVLNLLPYLVEISPKLPVGKTVLISTTVT